MTYEVICKHCGKLFTTHTRKSVFCSKECRTEYFIHKHLIDNSEKLKKDGIEGKDYVIDRWNGMAVRRMYGAYFKKAHPGRTIEEYKSEFPDAPIYSETDDLNVGKSRGLHMKEEKYKKLFSERIRGDKNPMSKTRTTEEQRKSNSPFSKAFYETRGLDDSERTKFIQEILSNRKESSFNTKLEYYISKGYTKQEAETLLRKRQSTKSLESCIKKYGKEYGEEIYRIRNSKWSAKMEEMSKKGEFNRIPKDFKVFSNKELRFINDLINSFDNIDLSKCRYYRERASDQLMLTNEGTHYLYDFVYGNKIIEFNGTYWHADPRFYESPETKIGKRTADAVWKRDAEKASVAAENGYHVFYVWEADYDSNKTEVIKRCIQFLTT